MDVVSSRCRSGWRRGPRRVSRPGARLAFEGVQRGPSRSWAVCVRAPTLRRLDVGSLCRPDWAATTGRTRCGGWLPGVPDLTSRSCGAGPAVRRLASPTCPSQGRPTSGGPFAGVWLPAWRSPPRSTLSSPGTLTPSVPFRMPCAGGPPGLRPVDHPAPRSLLFRLLGLLRLLRPYRVWKRRPARRHTSACRGSASPPACRGSASPPACRGPSPSRHRPPACRAPSAGPAARRNRPRQTCAQQPRVAPLFRSEKNPPRYPRRPGLPQTAWTIPTVPCPSCQTASRRYAHSHRHPAIKQLLCQPDPMDWQAVTSRPRRRAVTPCPPSAASAIQYCLGKTLEVAIHHPPTHSATPSRLPALLPVVQPPRRETNRVPPCRAVGTGRVVAFRRRWSGWQEGWSSVVLRFGCRERPTHGIWRWRIATTPVKPAGTS